MDLTLTPSEAAFRDELREWLAANHPGVPPGSGEEDLLRWRREWQRRLARDAWVAVEWPAEYGGRGASRTESAIFFDELSRARAPLPVDVIGLLLAGPTIMVWGTEEQRRRFLPPILTADEIWCQGFSEPDAGSDLAAVKTAARRHDRGWVVSGQKVWTTLAHHAKWCLLLARTDPDLPKHRGLSYLLLDMEQKGVSVRPLRQITGGAEFNEIFIDEARVADENLLGSRGNGWKVALTTLMNERGGLAFFVQGALRQQLDALYEEAERLGAADDPIVADRLADLQVRTETLRLLALRGLAVTERDGQPGPEGSLAKWLWSETTQRLSQLAVDLLGPDALRMGSDWAYALLRSRGHTIEGGTTEVQKNIVAERVLGLPKAR